jgi:hypothetical protein
MKKFWVTLSRGYVVTIEAEDNISAARNVEYFLGNSPDVSTLMEREAFKFNIENIDLTVNDVLEVEELHE